MGVPREFNVSTTAKHIVAAAVPLQEHRLPLTNLDFLLPPLDVYVFFCYKNNSSATICSILNDEGLQDNTFKLKVRVLKKALAEALAYFYPFAGEVVKNSGGEPEVLCNNRGVDFVEALADDVDLCELDLYNPNHSIEGRLVPRKKDAVFSVQVTELKCGGIVVACAFDHRVADAYSANMFWITWAEMATFKPISTTPCFNRSLVNPRSPLNYNSTFDEMYIPISFLSNSNPNQNMDPLISRVYFISKYQLDTLQSLAQNGCCKKISKLLSFSAFLWKIIASHACQLGMDNVSKISKMGIVVDGRNRLSNEESSEKAQAFTSYFGNVLSIPFGEQKCGNLKDMPISIMAKLVHDFLANSATKDHFLGLIDWVEAHRPEPAMSKIYCTEDGDGPAFVVSSGLRFPFSKVDFGWGKPTFGSYHFPWGGNCGYVMPMPTPSENGDWIVYMHLQKEQFDYIETQVPNVFKPFSLEMINSN